MDKEHEPSCVVRESLASPGWPTTSSSGPSQVVLSYGPKVKAVGPFSPSSVLILLHEVSFSFPIGRTSAPAFLPCR